MLEEDEPPSVDSFKGVALKLLKKQKTDKRSKKIQSLLLPYQSYNRNLF